MARIQAALDKVARALGLTQPLLSRAQRRYKANRRRAFEAHKTRLVAEKRADEARDPLKYPSPQMAARFDRKASRAHQRELKNHNRAQWWLGRVKALVQRVEGLETRQGELLEQRRKLSDVSIKGNHASGGTPHERLKAVALASAAACASGTRPNFYSQPGRWDIDHCITGESYGERSDCSSWFTSVYKSCDLEDPNGTNYGWGYTGTLVQNGEQISHAEVGCAVIYGSGTGHHVEMYVGPGSRTVGHGSAPVDMGVIDLFGDGQYRFFKFV